MVLYFIQLFCFGGMISCALHDQWGESLGFLLACAIASGFFELCEKIEKLGSAKSAKAENLEK